MNSDRKLRALLWLVIVLPAVFLLLMVQYSAITYPFADHCEFIGLFAKLHNHQLSWADLWQAHNHARPLTFRALILLNGALTGWDIRSEFVYLPPFLLAAFLVQ